MRINKKNGDIDCNVSFCILSYNKIDFTKKCLTTLMETKFPQDIEIIIVDNNSKDGSREWLCEFQKKYSSEHISIVLVFNMRNYGCTGGRNQACSMARGEYIFILDNDLEFIDPLWAEKMLNFYQKYPSIGILGPKLIFPDEPHLIQHAGFGVTKEGKISYWGYGANRYDERFMNVREVQGTAAACWLLKHSLFEEFGYFDDIYYPVNFEDADFCYRIRSKGYKVVSYPNVELYHSDHATTKNSEDLNYIRGVIKNGNVFRERWRDMYEIEDGMSDEEYTWELKK